MMKKQAISCLCLILLLISICCGCSKESSNSDLYTDSIQEADVLIEMPQLRQYGDYSCGTTCVQMIMNWLSPYEGDVNLEQYAEVLNTSKTNGTSLENITGFFDSESVHYSAKTGWTTEELAEQLKKGHPVMMAIQAWSAAEDGSYNLKDASNTETYLTEGHWVICVGYKKTGKAFRFYFNDPACVGHCVMDSEDLEERWIDMDANGEIVWHYGIAIEQETNYDPEGCFYLL